MRTKKNTLIKRITNAGMAVIMSAVMLLSGSAGSLTYAAAQDKSYEFDHARTAVAQLEDLFTTIDIMDATVASLSDEMAKGNVTSEQLVQMYIDRIQAYDKKKKLNSIISINPKALEEARALDEERAAGTVRGPLHGIPIGMHVVGKFGDEKSLMQIAYAYEQQAGPDIRQMPATTPALMDANLNAYLEALMDEVYSIDYAAFGSKPEGKVRLMEAAYDRASAVDRSDPYAVYDAAYDLAKAYDKTVAALKASGLNLAKAELTLSKSRYSYTGKKRTPAVDVKVGGVTLVQNQDYNVAYRNNLNVGTASVLITPAGAGYAGSKTAHFTIVKGKTTFKVKVSKKKIKVTNLSRGSSKVRFSVKKVTNGQMSKVKINSRTGKLTLKKGIKKCTIYVKTTSKANKNRKAKAKTIKTAVR